MREITADVEAWLELNKSVGLATVISTWGSAPRRVGAKMAFTLEGDISGSVSGGCVETAVLEIGLEVIRTDRPKMLHFGVADETAWGVGLACGGEIDVFVQPLNANLFERLHRALNDNQPAIRVLLLDGPEPWIGREVILFEDGSTAGSINPNLDGLVRDMAHEKVGISDAQRRIIQASAIENYLEGDELSSWDARDAEIFLETFSAEPTLIMVGGVHIAIALAKFAKILGYHTIVIDPRRAFSSPDRFLHADRLIQTWPTEAFKSLELTSSTAVVVLTHDPKIDDQALSETLGSPVFYIGALGSKKTSATRVKRLQEAGYSEDQIRRIHGPVGLNLGGQSPEEIALAILAEIVAVRYDKASAPKR